MSLLHKVSYRKAPHSSRCKGCSKPIVKDDYVYYAKALGCRCATCGNFSVESRVKPVKVGKVDKPEPKAEPASQPVQETRRIGGCQPPLIRFDEERKHMDIEFASLQDACLAGMAKGQGISNFLDPADCMLENKGEARKWLNNQDPGQLADIARDGSDKLTQLVEDMRRQITDDIPVPQQRKRKRLRGQDFGDEINQDRFYARVPEMWERMAYTPTTAKVLTVVLNCSVSATETQDSVCYRSAAAIALADYLTTQGISVEIVLVKNTASDPSDKVETYTTKIVLKRPEDPMNVSYLASACDIGVVRLGTILGSCRYLPGKLAMNLGVPKTIPAGLFGSTFQVDRDVNSKQAAVNWVKNCLTKFVSE